MDKDKDKNDKHEAPVATAAPPEPPKPYPAPGYPKVVFNKAGNAPPRIVNNDEELAALNPKEWTQIPPVEAKDASTWPKLYYDVNIPPKVIASEAEVAELGEGWREFPLPIAASPVAKASK